MKFATQQGSPMEAKRLKGTAALVLCGLLTTSLLACNSPGGTPPKAVKKENANLTASTVKSRITSQELDGATMRLNLFNVSYNEVSRFKFPIISFSFPEKADYVQLIRCRSDAKLGDLENIEIGATNTSSADQKYKTTDYWKNISGAFGCAVISTGVSVDKFVDYFASDGNWVYVGRACVHQSRVPTDSPEPTVSACSRQVSKSIELRGYINREKSISQEKKAEMMAQRDKIDSLGRNLVYKAKLLDTEISRCESERSSNLVSQKRRAAIGKLLGIGVGLGTKLIEDKTTKAVLGGLDVGGIFKDLSASSADFLPKDFCPAAERLGNEIEIDRQVMESESLIYSESLKLFGEPV